MRVVYVYYSTQQGKKMTKFARAFTFFWRIYLLRWLRKHLCEIRILSGDIPSIVLFLHRHSGIRTASTSSRRSTAGARFSTR